MGARTRARGMQSLGLNPEPVPVEWGRVEATPPIVGPSPWGARFPTQVAGYWPDIQKRCGVESLRSGWVVFTASDVPYWQQSAQPVNPTRLQTDGRAPGQSLGPAQVAQLLGPQRAARAAQLKAVAAGTLGW